MFASSYSCGAVVARLTQPLGSAGEAVQCSSRISACRREPNSHDAAKPPEPACPQKFAAARGPQARTSAEPNDLVAAEHGPGQRGSQQESNYLEPQCHIEPAHCVGSSGVQSVRGAAAASNAASGLGQLQRLEYPTRHGRQRGAGSAGYAPQGVTGPWQAHRQRASGAALPNPSLKRSANGRPPGPATGYGVHFPVAGPGVLP